MSYDTLFTTSCPDCGPIELSADQLWLVVPTTGESHYDFHCPACGRHVQQEIDPDSREILASLVAVEELDLPAELLELHEGPALTIDDLLDFMLALQAV